MNNSIIQQDDKTYIHIDEWYIGVHLDENGDLLLFIDHENGKVEEYNETVAEDEFQWGKAFYVSKMQRPPTPLPETRTMRSKVHIGVRQ